MTVPKTVQHHFARYLDELGFMPPPAEAVQDLAATAALAVHAAAGWDNWPMARRAVAEEQLTYKWTGIEVGDIDGLVGPATRWAREAYAYWCEHGALPTARCDERGGKLVLPTTSSPFPAANDAALIAFYGQPCIQTNLVKVPCPWRLKIAWDFSQTRTFLWAHKHCAEPLAEVLERVHDHYGPKAITALRLDVFSGDYNPRRMRGGSRWSKHAWGIAWDFDDVNNQLTWNHTRASLARSEYADWWAIWEALGFTSLGRTQDRDWMHIQATAGA